MIKLNSVLLLMLLFQLIAGEQTDVLQEIERLKSIIQMHIQQDSSSSAKLHRVDEKNAQENRILREKVKSLAEKLSKHESVDISIHSQIINEDSSDDAKLKALQDENQTLKQKLSEFGNKFKQHQEIDQKSHVTFESHVSQEEPTSIMHLLRSLATIVTGVGLGTLITQQYIPPFIERLFEHGWFRFLMIVLLAWQGGGGYDLFYSFLGSALFFLVISLLSRLNWNR